MPTTVTSSIGSAGGRTYSTIAAWEAAAPASLVTADQIWRGECYADSEFTSATTIVTIGGITTDSTRYVHLTAATGQSFQDNANVRTNALRYNAANGVAIRTTGAYGGPTMVNAVGNTRVERLQVSGANSLGPLELDNGTSPNCLVRDCIAVNTKGGAGTSSPTVSIVSIEGDAINVVVYSLGGGRNCIRLAAANRSVIGCTLVTPTDVQAGASGIGVHAFYAANIVVKSCAMIGMLTCTATTSTGSFSSSGGWNATNLASGLPGSTGNQHSVTYSQFTPLDDADKDSLDLRAIDGTALAANGYLDATNAPADIGGYTRADPPTIGAWELTAAAAAVEMMGQAMLLDTTH